MASNGNDSLVLDVESLNKELKEAHAPLGWQKAKEWFQSNFGDKSTAVRLKFLSSVMLTEKPLVHTEELAKAGIEAFHILQGDVIRSTAGLVPHPLPDYKEGENYYYLVIPASCSAQRYEYVLTARLIPILASTPNGQQLISETVNFKTHKFFYIPPLEEQPDDCVGNLANFQEVSYFHKNVLKVADRVASMTEVGWHFFNSFITFHFTRLSGDEFEIRKGTYAAKIEIEK